MRLYILRHGDAPYDCVSGERVLSSLGKNETREVIQRHAGELSAVPLIMCSTTRRARETLAVVTQVLAYQGELLFDDCLRSASSVSAVEARIDNLYTDSILLVSHQPLVGYLLEYLTNQSSIGMAMSTSSLACLDLSTFKPWLWQFELAGSALDSGSVLVKGEMKA